VVDDPPAPIEVHDEVHELIMRIHRLLTDTVGTGIVFKVTDQAIDIGLVRSAQRVVFHARIPVIPRLSHVMRFDASQLRP